MHEQLLHHKHSQIVEACCAALCAGAGAASLGILADGVVLFEPDDHL